MTTHILKASRYYKDWERLKKDCSSNLLHYSIFLLLFVLIGHLWEINCWNVLLKKNVKFQLKKIIYNVIKSQSEDDTILKVPPDIDPEEMGTEELGGPKCLWWYIIVGIWWLWNGVIFIKYQ